MWSFAIKASAALALVIIALPASGEQSYEQDKVLSNQLNKVESSVIQRQNRTPRTSDLLTDQNLRASEQRLNTLKTRTPRNTKIPSLERQYDRVQRQNRRFNR